MGSFYSKKERKGYGCLIVGWWQSKAGGWRTRNGASYIVAFEILFGFFCLILSWKPGSKIGKFAVIDHTPSICGCFIQKLWFGFQGWLLKTLRVRDSSTFIYDLAIVHLNIQSLSVIDK